MRHLWRGRLPRPMIRGEFPDAGESSPETLRRAYERRLSTVVDATGVEAVAEETGIERERLAGLADGAAPEFTLEEAAAVLALEADAPPADAIAAEARDVLLMGMTTAVVDVEGLASELDAGLGPKEIQQKVEGRYPMTLAEYALIHHHLESGDR